MNSVEISVEIIRIFFKVPFSMWRLHCICGDITAYEEYNLTTVAGAIITHYYVLTVTKLKKKRRKTRSAEKVFMRAKSSSHCVQLDYGAVNWPKDAAVVIADSASLDTFSKHVAGDKLAVYVWEETLTQSLPENGRTLVGVAAA